MVHPLLDSPLHTYLHQPVHIVGRSLIIWRLSHQFVNFLLGIALGGIQAVHIHPFHELGMIDNIFLERVAYLVDEVHMDIGIVGIYLAAAFINGQKYRLYTTRSLCHQRGRTRRSNGQTGYIASSVLYHILVQLLVGLLQTQNEGILGLALGVVNLKGTTFLCHLYTRPIGVQRQCLVYLYAEVGSLLSTIA